MGNSKSYRIMKQEQERPEENMKDSVEQIINKNCHLAGALPSNREVISKVACLDAVDQARKELRDKIISELNKYVIPEKYIGLHGRADADKTQNRIMESIISEINKL